MLMCPDNRRINKEVACKGTILGLEILPEPAPNAASFPAAKAVVHRVPVAKIGWEVAPRCARARQIEHGFDKQPITECWGTASTRLYRSEDGRNLRPCLICQQQTDGHQIPPFHNVWY